MGLIQGTTDFGAVRDADIVIEAVFEEMAVKKEIRHLDKHCRAFIAASPFVVMATSDASGRCDATPRGDDPGFGAGVDRGDMFDRGHQK